MAKSGFAKEQLKSFIDRIERLEEEKSALGSDIREVFAEAKGTGFDTKIMRRVIAFRKLDRADYQEQAAIFDLYWDALDGTPLGDYGIKRAAKDTASSGIKKYAELLRTAMGTPVAITEEERAKGVIGAFEKDGHRSSIAFPERAEQ